MKILVKLIVITFSLALIFFYLVYNKSFTVINSTNEPISTMNFQYVGLEGDPTISEMESYADRYTLENNDTRHFRVLMRNLLKRNLYIGIDFFYELRDPEKKEYYSLKGTTFSTEPQYEYHQAYCSFEINVYPNRKTIVTPTRKWGCINPMYYHQ